MNESFWSRFSADPRIHGTVRASDADRAVVTEVLSQAFALGQLGSEELDARIDAAAQLRTLGEIPALVEDLVVDATDNELATMDEAARTRALERLTDERIPITPEQIDAAAADYYRKRVRQSVFGMLAGPVGITLAIWAATSLAAGGLIFFWPIFVIIPMAFGVIAEVTGRERIIRRRKRELIQRARAHLGDVEAQRRLEARRRRQERREREAFGDGDPPLGALGLWPGLHGPSQEPPISPVRHPHSREEIRRRRREARLRRRRDRGD